MRIALANNRWVMVGGTTKYLFSVRELLEAHGHEVLPFGNLYPDTREDVDTKWFVKPPGGRQELYYGDAPLSVSQKWGMFRRGVFDPEVRRAARAMFKEEGVDLLYTVNIANFLGPAVSVAAHDVGIPHVMRLSDFNLLCPAYNFVRDGGACEDCTRGLHHAVLHKCLRDSVSVSAARVAAMWVHRALRFYHRVDAIVTPTRFMREKLLEAGYDSDRIHYVPTFRNDPLAGHHRGGAGFVLYAGRLAPEKGVQTLIRAFAMLDPELAPSLVLLGKGDRPFEESLRRLAAELAPERVEFRGFCTPEEVEECMRTAALTVVPSEWYENMPNSLTEAMAVGCPVVATAIGSLPEQIEDGVSGRLAEPWNPSSLSDAIRATLTDPVAASAMARRARDKVMSEYSPDAHIARLDSIFETALDRRSQK